MLSIKHILNKYTQQLAKDSSSARLDCELLLCHVLQCERAYLYAHDDIDLNAEQLQTFQQLFERRTEQEPIAYILGQQEFWSLPLDVTPDVLIPRPETECLVEWILQTLPADKPCKIADLGAGSGAIAIALAHERPHWQLVATDKQLATLAVAKRNAEKFNLTNIVFLQSDWCAQLPKTDYEVIVSNPPYVEENDLHLKNLQHEPTSALVAEQNGFKDLQTIMEQAQNYLCANGCLVLEHGYQQQNQLIDILKQQQYQNIAGHLDLANNPRFITCRKSSAR